MDVNKRVIELNEERERAIKAERAVLLDIESEKRAPSAEDEQKLARIDADIVRIQNEVKSLVSRGARDTEFEAIRAANESLFGEHSVERTARTENEQIRAWLESPAQHRGDYEIDIAAARAERQAIRAGASAEELRAMNYQTSSGSLVVPTTMARELYQYLEASIAAFRVGARQLSTSTGERLLLPKLGAHGAAIGSIPQGTAIAGSDPTFGQVALDAYKYGQLVDVSNELVRDSAFDIASWLAMDIGYAIGRLVDTDLIVGVGTANPKGMTVLAGAGTNAPITTGGSLITPSVEKLIDTVYSVNDAYRQMGAAWLMKDSSAGTLRKLRDGAGGTIGAFIWESSLFNGIENQTPDRLLGYPVFTDPNCATQGSNAVYATFGWFGEYIYRTVGNVAIESSEHFRWSTDQVSFRGKWTVDGDHRDVGALNNLVMNV
jgi:HK97 family phage major capsid protein